LPGDTYSSINPPHPQSILYTPLNFQWPNEF
jgi:hypothetical protein